MLMIFFDFLKIAAGRQFGKMSSDLEAEVRHRILPYKRIVLIDIHRRLLNT